MNFLYAAKSCRVLSGAFLSATIPSPPLRICRERNLIEHRIGKKMMMKKVLTICVWMMIGTGICAAQGTTQVSSFTFQGKLNDGGVAANGNYDMAFRLYDDVNAGTQIGVTITLPNVLVANGIFSVELDFGQFAFVTDSQRYLEIGIRPAGSSAPLTMLSPRQKLASSPFATKSYYSTLSFQASTLVCSNCVQDSAISSVSGNKVIGAVNEAATVSSGAGAGILNVLSLSGASGDILGASTDYVFVGPTVSVTLSSATTANRRVTGSASVAMSGTTSAIRYAVCYQVDGSGPLFSISAVTHLVTVTTTRSSFAFSGSGILPIGTHPIGFCVRNPGSTITGVENVTGWVMAPK